MEMNDLKILYDVMVETDPDHIPFRAVNTRKLPIVERKQMFALLARDFGATLTKIACFLNTTHPNVSCSTKRMRGYLDVYPAMKRRYREVRDEFEYRTMGPPPWVAD